jgi:hypothetical protein
MCGNHYTIHFCYSMDSFSKLQPDRRSSRFRCSSRFRRRGRRWIRCSRRGSCRCCGSDGRYRRRGRDWSGDDSGGSCNSGGGSGSHWSGSIQLVRRQYGYTGNTLKLSFCLVWIILKRKPHKISHMINDLPVKQGLISERQKPLILVHRLLRTTVKIAGRAKALIRIHLEKSCPTHIINGTSSRHVRTS